MSELTEVFNKKRTIRLMLTKEQIELLVSYAMHNGFKRKAPGQKMDMTEQNLAAKWAIMSRLGFDN